MILLLNSTCKLEHVRNVNKCLDPTTHETSEQFIAMSDVLCGSFKTKIRLDQDHKSVMSGNRLTWGALSFKSTGKSLDFNVLIRNHLKQNIVTAYRIISQCCDRTKTVNFTVKYYQSHVQIHDELESFQKHNRNETCEPLASNTPCVRALSSKQSHA